VLTIEQAVAEAITIAEPVESSRVTTFAGTPPAASGVAVRFGLTPREIEVLHLLAQRLTDREIADALFLSQHTVGRHVQNILGKLDVRNRREAGALAEREGLT
jgi:DNA-binding NarL/FixJ family response regulator